MSGEVEVRVRIPAGLLRRLDRIAKAEHRSRPKAVAQAIAEYVDRANGARKKGQDETR